MPNWCTNHVELRGSEQDIMTMIDAIKDAMSKEQKDGCGQHIYDTISSHRYCFFTELNDFTNESVRFNFDTKWTPDLDMVAEWCRKLNLSGRIAYEECGMQIYGYAIISKTGDVVDRQVDQKFIDQIEYVEDDDGGDSFYKFGNDKYECITDLINEKYYGTDVL